MVGTLYKTAGAALALALGATALAAPAAAQDRGDRGWGEHRGGDGDRGGRPGGDRGGDRGGGNWGGRSDAPRPERPAGGWNGAGDGGDRGGGGRPAWNGPTAQPVPPAAVPQAAPQPRAELPRNPGPAADPRPNRGYGGGPATAERRGAPQQGWDGQRWNGQNWNSRGPDPRPNGQRDRRADDNRGWNRDRGADRGWDRGDPRRNSWSAGRPGGWDRDWRRDNRFNWQGWRNGHRDVFRIGRYNPPYRSYSYRRLSIGLFLDGGFFGANYWINDPWMYRLPPAYGPYRWVRYYDDALLVDTYSGEVVDAIYDFFW